MKEQRSTDPEAIFKALREVAPPARKDADIEARREAIAAVARAIRGRPRWGVLRAPSALAAALVGAAAVLALVAAWRWSQPYSASSATYPRSLPSVAVDTAIASLRTVHGTVVIASHGRGGVVVPGGVSRRVTEGDRITSAGDSRAALQVDGGAHVDVDSSTNVVLARAGGECRLELAMGRVALDVPKLTDGRTVVIQTPDARVSVRGTRFSVEVRSVQGAASGASALTVTSVKVSHGAVLVTKGDQQTLVSSGESWSSALVPPVEPVAVAPSSATNPPRPPGSSPSVQKPSSPNPSRASGQGAPGPRRSVDGPTPTETLTAENELFQSALNARNTGDARRAAGLLGELLARFPNSPVAHEALVERFRLLEQTGERTAAAREARRYLQRYPGGAAATEAQRLLDGGSKP